MKSSDYLISLVLLFLSGIAALIYQTLWIKQLGWVTGVDVYAVTVGISAFFAGLALGAMYFGKLADKSKAPFRMFAMIELGIAIAGISATLLLFKAPLAFVSIQKSVGVVAWVIPFLLVGVPAFFMGGSLPVVLRYIQPKQHQIGKASGYFYAVNTAGAILGTLVVPFALIPALGLINTALVAASLNLGIALVALLYSRRNVLRQLVRREPVRLTSNAKIALWLYAIAGGIALGYEVVWSQSLAPLLSSRVYAFAVMLAVYLFGLVLGSYLFAQFAHTVQKPWRVFGYLIAGAGLAALFQFAMLDGWVIDLQNFIGKTVFSWTQSDQIANAARFGSSALLMLFIPTTLLGAAFPACLRIIATENHIGRDVGFTAGYNTAGGIFGSMLTGFVLIPMLGVVKSLALLAFVATLVGIYPMIKESQTKLKVVMASIAPVLVVIMAMVLPSDKIASLLTERRGGETIFYSEKAGGSVAVVQQETPSGDFRRLYIHGVSNSGNSMPSLRYMRLQALLPLLIHNGEPKSAMVIGFGTGITIGALKAYPNLEDAVCVELMPGVLEAADYFQENNNVINDPQVDFKIKDGRHELLANEQKYDMITLEPPPPTAAGVVNLYSSEFYKLANSRLNKYGILAQWWPLAAQNEEVSKSLVRSFLDNFTYVSLWTTELHETLLIGSNDPIELDFQKIKARFDSDPVRDNLSPVGVQSAEDLLSTYLTNGDELITYVDDAKPVTDNFPTIEYASWTRDGEFPRVLTGVSRISSEVPIINADTATVDLIETKRQKLWTLYRAGYYLYLRDTENWEAMLKRIIPELKSNPYYRSFVPDG